MNKLLKFLDFSCIDPRLYWRIPSLEGDEVFEIQWRRDERVRWRLRKVGALLWELSSDATLAADLDKRQIDRDLFETKLKTTLLHQVTFAHRIVDDARRLFGNEDVSRAIDEQKAFLQQLEGALAKLTQGVSSEAAPSTKNVRPQLRMLKQVQLVPKQNP